jgi:hypothetical protein
LNRLKQSKNKKNMDFKRSRDLDAEIRNFKGVYCKKTGAHT